MKRPRRWLKINGKVNVLRNHLANHGHSRWKVNTLAKQNDCLPSEIPLEVLTDFFGCTVKDVGQPDNWQKILYGSKRGAQKNIPKGKKEATYAARKERQAEIYDRIEEPVKRFMSMRISRNPADSLNYY